MNLFSLNEKLNKQIDGREVEVLWLGDNKSMSIGEKREHLINISKGDYVSFIDDDDDISDTYIDDALKAFETNPDVVTFECEYKNKDTNQRVRVKFGMDYINEDIKDVSYRMPYPICFIKKVIALQVKFPHQNLGEDTVFAKQLFDLCFLQKEIHIPKVLYYYNHNPKISTCSLTKYTSPKNKVDVVIVSDGRLRKNELTTQQCLLSLGGHTVSTVVERHPKLVYLWSNTIRQKGNFNLYKFYNEGASEGKAPVIVFCKNDVVFHENFIHNVSKLIQGYDGISFNNKNVLCVTRDAYKRVGFDFKDLKILRSKINIVPLGA